MSNFAVTVSSITVCMILSTVFSTGLKDLVQPEERRVRTETQLYHEMQEMRFYPEFRFANYPSHVSMLNTSNKNAYMSFDYNNLTMIYFCSLIILQSGDCEINPGPKQSGSHNNSEPKFPCQICEVPCLWGERAICCDGCDGWLHVDCMGMKTCVYEVLEQHSSMSWICCQCGIPNFATSLFSAGSLDTMNSFSSLDTVDTDNCPLTSPLAASSPHEKSNRTAIDNTKSFEYGHTQKRFNEHKQESKKPKAHGTKPYKPLKTLVINFQSIRGKTAELNVCLEMDNPDVIIGSETWLDSSVNNSEIFPNTYTVFRKDRPEPSANGVYHGGVLIAVKSEFICAQRFDLDTNCEILWCEMNIIGAKPVLIGSFYRPPNSDRDYLDKLKESIAKINLNNYSNLWLAGDFNLGDIIWESQSVRQGAPKPSLCRDLIDISNDYGLEQLVEL